MAESVETPKKRVNLLNSFVNGARKGLNMAFTSMVPNVIFAFALIQFLNITGLTDLIGSIFGPFMGLFGLPGEAATVVLAGLLSTGGGFGAAASLATAGVLNASHCAILLVGIALFGSLVQYSGRVLGTAGVPSKHFPALIVINLITAFLAMFVTQFFV